MSTGALVAIVAGVLVLVGAGVTWLVLFIRRRRRRVQVRIAADLSSETALRGPGVGGNGRLVLTSSRLIFRIYVGTDVVIALEQITGLREQATYQHRRIGGRRFMIVVTDAGEVAFAVREIAAWMAAIEQAAPRSLAVS